MVICKEKHQQRLRAIIEEVLQVERISVDQLSDALGVSPATIRRDLALLDNGGLLRRDHGGVTAIEPLFYEAFAHDSSFQDQVHRQSQEKKRIGMAAAELIQDGETVALGAGTTTTQVARSIPFQRKVTVFTNAINVAMELARRKKFDVVLSGGALRGAWFSLVGTEAIESAKKSFYDKLFIGVSGISLEAGLTDFHSEEASVNRALLAQTRRRIVVADHTKFSVVATSAVGALDAVDLIITDTGLPEESARLFLERGVSIRRV